MRKNPLELEPNRPKWLPGLLLWVGVGAAALLWDPVGAWVRSRLDPLFGRTAPVVDDRSLQGILQDDDVAALRQRLEKGADPDSLDTFGQPLIHWAQSPAALDLLLRYGADPNGRDKDGDTPLMEVIRSRSLESVELLLAAKADVNAVSPPETGTWTALDDARANHQPEVERLLRAAGAKELRVTKEDGLPLPADGGPPFAVVCAYLEAVRGKDYATVLALQGSDHDPAASPPTEEQWKTWRGVRPVVPIFGGGYYWGGRASLTVIGQAPGGFDLEWVIHLRRITAEETTTTPEDHQGTLDGEWRIVREDWIVDQ